LFQMAALFDSLTIYDNVAFGPREHKLYDPEALSKVVADRLAEVGLPHGLEHKKPAELSGGQRKRVGLARALALNPEVMLYDEPTTGLDPIMTDVINELILQTQRTKKTTGVVVTHEMKTVAKVADRVIMFYPLARLRPDEPQILYDGSPEGLENHPDSRIRQFIRGEAGERLKEMAQQRDA
jgi:phospholipid/cholesterol/gamma-HCH transport system ATP-binding protein